MTKVINYNLQNMQTAAVQMTASCIQGLYSNLQNMLKLSPRYPKINYNRRQLLIVSWENTPFLKK